MAKTYPILINGEEKGLLTVTPRGLVTEFSARCADAGRLIRLSVYGEEKEGYLGVMEPVGGELGLCRKLSRAAMAGFPTSIEYAAESGAAHVPAAPPPGGDKPPAEPKPPSPRRNAAQRPKERDVIWYSAGDGSLYTAYEGRSYRAIPMAAWGLPMERAVERRVIDGVEYAVFALDEGQII